MSHWHAPLNDYVVARRKDDNHFWYLPAGEHLNLLSDAIDRIRDLEATLTRWEIPGEEWIGYPDYRE